MPSRVPGHFLRLAAASVLSAACEATPPGTGTLPAPPIGAVTIDTVPPRPAGAAADTLAPFADRVVIYIEATQAEQDVVRSSMSDDDFYVTADDFMFYRGTAYKYLDEQGLPVHRLEGRRALHFIVNGEVRRYDFAKVETLDIVVLYDANREPRVIAPVDIAMAAEYFGGGPGPVSNENPDTDGML